MNRETINKIFLNYVSAFDLNNPAINRKYQHSLHVALECTKIAESLFMSRDEVELLYIIGLIHDIGSFSLIKNFNDNNALDHVDVGLRILFDEGVINKFNLRDDCYEIIKMSIYAHNKVVIPDGYSVDMLKYANILRDADKIDILLSFKDKTITIDITEGDITASVWEIFKSHKPINKELCMTGMDNLLKVLGYIYDINYKYSLFIIENQMIIEGIINNYRSINYTVKRSLDYVQEELNKYMKIRMGG